MLSKKVYIILFINIFTSVIFGQNAVTIHSIRQKVLSRRTSNELFADTVQTTGIVTAIIKDSIGNESGFYIQSPKTKDDTPTSNAIFVETNKAKNLSIGDEIHLNAIAEYQDGHCLLSSPEKMTIIAKNQKAAAITVTFPADFSDYSKYEGMTLTFHQTLFVTNNYSLEKYGELTLSSHRLHAPTEVTEPGSNAYNALVASNKEDQIILDDGSNQYNPSPLPFIDADGTRRIGSRVDNLTATLVKTSYGYMLYPSGTPTFYGNPRPTSPESNANYNVKICSFNLEYYLVSNFGTGYGPDNETDAARQHEKTLKALLAIDADIYGLIEIQTGQNAIAEICSALNTATNSNHYAYINDGTSTNGTYTKVGYIYRSDKISPIKSIKSNDTGVNNRKKGQGFTLISNGESFVYLLNHYKAKSGSGTGGNADQGDGQGTFNADRVVEAQSTLSFATTCKNYYGDNDVLITGDLNAYSMEDPITTLEKGGYSSQMIRFMGDSAYSYNYRSTSGCLDHALANPSMAQQITGCSVFHINTDEPTMFEYSAGTDTSMYRCSDHDPVIVTLNLGSYSDSVNASNADKMSIIPNPVTDKFYITNSKDYNVKIMTYQGIVLYQSVLRSNDVMINAKEIGLMPGIYIVQCTENVVVNPKVHTIKLIVK